MARTKLTARKTTGGKAPRKSLSSNAYRAAERISNQARSRSRSQRQTDPAARDILVSNGNFQPASESSNGRPKFYRANMIKNDGGKYFNFHGLRPAKGTGLDNSAIDQVIAQWNPSDRYDCPDTIRRDLRTLVTYIQEAQLNFADFYAMIKTIQADGQSMGVDIDVPNKSQNPGANFAIKRRSRSRSRNNGRSGSNGNTNTVSDNPTFVWALAERNCTNMGFILDGIRDIVSRDYKLELSGVPDYRGYKMKSTVYNNDQVIRFWQQVTKDYPGCKQIDVGYLERLLDDIDTAHIKNVQMTSVLREFTIQAGGPVVNLSMIRGQDPFAEEVEPKPGTKAARSKAKDRLKGGILLYLAENYCQNIPQIVAHIEQVFDISPDDSVNTTNLRFPATYGARNTLRKPAKAVQIQTPQPQAPTQAPASRTRSRSRARRAPTASATTTVYNGSTAAPAPQPTNNRTRSGTKQRATGIARQKVSQQVQPRQSKARANTAFPINSTVGPSIFNDRTFN